jgi:hypothetical protein
LFGITIDLVYSGTVETARDMVRLTPDQLVALSNAMNASGKAAGDWQPE